MAIYSTIRLGNNNVAHVFDYINDKTLCGLNRWHHTPFKLNKTKLNDKDMLFNHKGFAIRRGAQMRISLHVGNVRLY